MQLARLAEAPSYDDAHVVAQSFLDAAHCTVRVIKLSPGQVLPPHTHGVSDLMLYVVEGAGHLDTSDGQVAFAVGSLAHLRGDEELRLTNTGSDGMTLLAFSPHRSRHARTHDSVTPMGRTVRASARHDLTAVASRKHADPLGAERSPERGNDGLASEAEQSNEPVWAPPSTKCPLLVGSLKHRKSHHARHDRSDHGRWLYERTPTPATYRASRGVRALSIRGRRHDAREDESPTSRMIDRLVLLGATGDLAGLHVLPALAALHAARKLPHRFAVVGAGRAQLDDETFRRGVAEQLDSHAAAVPATSRDATVMATRYRQVDLADPKSGAVVTDAASGDAVPPLPSTLRCRRACSRRRCGRSVSSACPPAAGSSWRSPSARISPAPSRSMSCSMSCPVISARRERSGSTTSLGSRRCRTSMRMRLDHVLVWRTWMRRFSYEGRRSCSCGVPLTLKLLDDWSNGSLVAAPTSSLPAPVGGVRNWDYRYTWVRDAAFSVWALRRIGFEEEACGFLGWVLDAFEGTRSPRIMYDVSGAEVPDEWEDPELEGYRASTPVRWGNGAADQRQHDVSGKVLDCAHLWVASGGPIDARLWQRLSRAGGERLRRQRSGVPEPLGVTHRAGIDAEAVVDLGIVTEGELGASHLCRRPRVRDKASVRVWRPSSSMSDSSPVQSLSVKRTRRLWTDTARTVALGLPNGWVCRRGAGEPGDAPRTWWRRSRRRAGRWSGGQAFTVRGRGGGRPREEP